MSVVVAVPWCMRSSCCSCCCVFLDPVGRNALHCGGGGGPVCHHHHHHPVRCHSESRVYHEDGSNYSNWYCVKYHFDGNVVMVMMMK